MNIDVLFDHFNTLPPASHVVQEVLAHFQQDGRQANELIELIESDPVLYARLLQVANSARFQMPQRIQTAQQAVQLLGLVNVRTLVISIGLIHCFKQLPATLLQPMWQHDLYTATAARQLALRVDVDAGLAYALGLLHGIGQLVMRIVQPEAMLDLDEQVSPQAPQRLILERQTFGYAYTDVSAELTRRWQFPNLFEQVLAGASDPLTHSMDADVATLAALIHLSAWLAWANDLSPQTTNDSWPVDVAKKLGLPNSAAELALPPLQSLCPALQDLIH